MIYSPLREFAARPNEVTAANAGGRYRLPIRKPWTARIAEFVGHRNDCRGSNLRDRVDRIYRPWMARAQCLPASMLGDAGLPHLDLLRYALGGGDTFGTMDARLSLSCIRPTGDVHRVPVQGHLVRANARNEAKPHWRVRSVQDVQQRLVELLPMA